MSIYHPLRVANINNFFRLACHDGAMQKAKNSLGPPRRVLLPHFSIIAHFLPLAFGLFTFVPTYIFSYFCFFLRILLCANEELLHFNLAAAVQCARTRAGGCIGSMAWWLVGLLDVNSYPYRGSSLNNTANSSSNEVQFKVQTAD